MRVHLIDIGQGAATLVEFSCGAILIDTGGESHRRYDSTESLMTYLKAFFKTRPDLKLAGTISSVSPVPISPGSFELRMAVETRVGEGQPLLPSMACAVKFVPYLNEKALTVPVAAVFEDETSDDASCVYVVGKDRKPEKRIVTVGKKTDKKAEIITGLREGDQVLLEKPTDGGLAAGKPAAATPPAGKDAGR